MFDTNVSVDIVRGLAPAVLWFNALPEPAFIAGFAYMKIIEGCKDKAEIRRVRMLLSPLNISGRGKKTANEAWQISRSII